MKSSEGGLFELRAQPPLFYERDPLLGVFVGGKGEGGGGGEVEEGN